MACIGGRSRTYTCSGSIELVAYCLVGGKTKSKFRFRSEETKMKKLLGITAILLCTVIAACSGQPPNPLLGKWKIIARSGDLARYDAYCPSYMVFTDTTQTLTYAGKPASEKVTFNAMQTAVYPTTVYVIGNAGHRRRNERHVSSAQRRAVSAAGAARVQPGRSGAIGGVPQRRNQGTDRPRQFAQGEVRWTAAHRRGHLTAGDQRSYGYRRLRKLPGTVS